MGRPKEFDPDVALDRAMDVFWRKGFDATSVQDLVEHMGINRGSLYDTFGDKKSLFMQVIDRYARRVACGLIDVLESPAPARQVLTETFKLVVERAGQEDRRGCLMVNVTVANAQRCRETAAKVAAALNRTEDAFCKVLSRGKSEGDLPERIKPRAVARYLVTVLQGLVVMSKANVPKSNLRETVKVALSVLD